MTAFELVVIVLSVVISLAFTHLLTGIAQLIRARKVKFSIIHAAWIGQMLFTCVDIDLQAYHRDNRRRYLGAYAFYYLLGGAINLTIPGMESAALLAFGLVAVLGAAWLWPDRRVQLAVIVVNCAAFTWYGMHYIAVL